MGEGYPVDRKALSNSSKYSRLMREVMRWPIWLTLLIICLDLSILLSIWASLGNLATVVTAAILAISTIFFYRATSLTIEIDSERLIAGRANIEIAYLKRVEILSEEEMSFHRGAGINPQAFLALRFWVKGGLKIEIADPRDPTPFWLVSSENPARFAEKLNL
ncbi:MAG: DUF3093 domain-containing protein [Actinobacteria bacterium]|nr:DUF3093 domain-containing protein [Actinomycetota bacterium]NBO47277.1 DUF3093 domain-containing protein [Actinomycetota bacterium]NBP12023.1 DUF3093 domain-containing protein [Actinomycetota bacterium]NBP22160.1 DUF3093 domain-containing protein [Actinomycetota bacterium]NBP42813.1 DUF3093 domain-containing protein [Actinomycetota bacterium]